MHWHNAGNAIWTSICVFYYKILDDREEVKFDDGVRWHRKTGRAALWLSIREGSSRSRA